MRSARVLVVDDEPGMLRAVERVLSDEHDVVATRRSREALAVAEEFRPDLAIVDIRMPDLDGFELMTRLKASVPGIDVILMTGSVDDLDEKLVRALRSPAFYFIQKPFDRDVFRTLVERCVELRWRREEHRQHLQYLETEMAQARAFQQSLLPTRETTIGRVAVCCRYTPCSALGGDLCDYAEAPGVERHESLNRSAPVSATLLQKAHLLIEGPICQTGALDTVSCRRSPWPCSWLSAGRPPTRICGSSTP